MLVCWFGSSLDFRHDPVKRTSEPNHTRIVDFQCPSNPELAKCGCCERRIRDARSKFKPNLMCIKSGIPHRGCLTCGVDLRCLKVPRQARMNQDRRKLAAIAAFDVVGYSRLMERNESRTLAKLTSHRNDRLEPSILRHGGRLVKLIGDGALVEFASAVEAVNAAIEFQQAMAQTNLDEVDGEQLVFRIGVHVGDVIVDGDDLYGDGVNVAARLEGEATPGGVVISGNTRDAVFNRVHADFRDLGLISLKNIERPVQAFQIIFDREERGAPDSKPPERMTEAGEAGISSIAVRPFQNLADKRELDFFADGLVEDIVALLARVPGFFVISKASTFVFRNPDTPASTIARQLGVRYVLGGSVRAQDDHIRVSTELADAATGRVLWSRYFDGQRTDVIKLQDEITRNIIIELQPALTQAEIAVIRRQRPENIGAWGCYHQAQGILASKGWSARSIEEAQEFLRRALQLDPGFALARAQLALYLALAQTTGLVEQAASLREEAVAAAELAIADDNGSSEVLGYAGCAIADLGDRSRGAEILQQAVDLDPSNAQAHVALGAALGAAGDLEDGIAWMRHGIKLSPRDRKLGLWGWVLGMYLMRAKRPQEAYEEVKLATRRDPRLFLLPVLESLVHVALGRNDLAKASLTAARRLGPELTLSKIAVSHGRRAAGVLADFWDDAIPKN
jgi:adenylate cyclase